MRTAREESSRGERERRGRGGKLLSVDRILYGGQNCKRATGAWELDNPVGDGNRMFGRVSEFHEGVGDEFHGCSMMFSAPL